MKKAILLSVMLCHLLVCGAYAQTCDTAVELASGTLLELSAITFPTDEIGFAGGENGIFLTTTDGGDTWSALTLGLNDDINDLYFLSTQIGFAAGDGGIYNTTNSGSTWNHLVSFSGKANSVCFYSQSSGYVAGDDGDFYRIIDGQVVYSTVLNGGEDLDAIWFINPANGFIGGKDGYFAMTADSGKSWTSVTSPANDDVVDIQFTTPTTGFAVAEDLLMKTTDGGANWNTVLTSPNRELTALFFTDSDTGYIVGAVATLKRTTDGANDFQDIFSGSVAFLNDITISPSGYVYAAGMGGSILKITCADSTKEPTAMVPVRAPYVALSLNNGLLYVRLVNPDIQQTQLFLTDLSGRHMTTVDLDQDREQYVDVQRFPAGIYLIQGHIDGKAFSKKIFIEN